MALFGIYIPDGQMSDDAQLSEAEIKAHSVAIKDRFSTLAFIFPTFWLLFKGCWIPLALFAAFQVILFTGFYMIAGDQFEIFLPLVSIILTCASLFIGFEAHRIEAFALSQKGYHQSALITAGTDDEAIAKYFDLVCSASKGDAD